MTVRRVEFVNMTIDSITTYFIKETPPASFVLNEVLVSFISRGAIVFTTRELEEGVLVAE
jgi:hypothetical protein